MAHPARRCRRSRQTANHKNLLATRTPIRKEMALAPAYAAQPMKPGEKITAVNGYEGRNRRRILPGQTKTMVWLEGEKHLLIRDQPLEMVDLDPDFVLSHSHLAVEEIPKIDGVDDFSFKHVAV